jgi:hypothetical protein
MTANLVDRHLFLARANDKLGNFEAAEKAYLEASRMKKADVQVWLGLRDLYESQGSAKVSRYIEVSETLAHIYETVFVSLLLLFSDSSLIDTVTTEIAHNQSLIRLLIMPETRALANNTKAP